MADFRDVDAMRGTRAILMNSPPMWLAGPRNSYLLMAPISFGCYIRIRRASSCMVKVFSPRSSLRSTRLSVPL